MNFKVISFKNVLCFILKLLVSFNQFQSKINNFNICRIEFLDNCYHYRFVSSMFHAMKLCAEFQIHIVVVFLPFLDNYVLELSYYFRGY